MAFKNFKELKQFIRQSMSNNTFTTNEVQSQIADYFEGKDLKLFAKDHNKQWEEVNKETVKDLADVAYDCSIKFFMVGFEKGVWCFPASLVDKTFKLFGLTYSCIDRSSYSTRIDLRRDITDEEIKQFNANPSNKLQQYLKNVWGEFGCVSRYMLNNAYQYESLKTQISKNTPYVSLETVEDIEGNGLWYYTFNHQRITVYESKTKDLFLMERFYPGVKLEEIVGSFSIPHCLLKSSNTFSSLFDNNFSLATEGPFLNNVFNPEHGLTHSVSIDHNLTVLITESQTCNSSNV